MSTHEDRIEKTLGIMTGDFSGDIPAPESRIEVLLHKILENKVNGGFRSIVLSSSQYDLTRKPIIDDPEEGVIYLVPNGDDGDNTFDEWMYLNDSFEKIGSSTANILPDVTASDNGKVLMVVNGNWTKAAIPSATGVSF